MKVVVGGREGGREGGRAAYLRDVWNTEASFEGGVAEEEGLPDREYVGSAPVEEAAGGHLGREGGREGGREEAGETLGRRSDDVAPLSSLPPSLLTCAVKGAKTMGKTRKTILI